MVYYYVYLIQIEKIKITEPSKASRAYLQNKELASVLILRWSALRML